MRESDQTKLSEIPPSTSKIRLMFSEIRYLFTLLKVQKAQISFHQRQRLLHVEINSTLKL